MYPPTANQSYCVEFYYVLVGSNNTLNLLVESNTGSQRIIFTRNYDHGFVWSKGEATITAVNEFQLVFQVINGYLRQGTVKLTYNN